MKITRKGYYEVYRPDGSYVSRHTSRDESYEAITEDGQNGTYRIVCPDREVEVLLGVVGKEVPPATPSGSYTPTHFVAPYASVSGATSDEDTVNGTAFASATSAGTPCTLGEALLEATAGNIIQMAPGTYTGTSTGARNSATWQPTNSGTSGNPIIFFAEYPGAYNASNRTSLSNGVSAQDNTGCPTFGVVSTDYFIWDGPYVDEATSQYHSDTAPCILWDTTGSELRRCFVENDGNTTHTPADNHSSYRFELATDCVLSDCKGTGSYSATNRENGSAVITYECINLEIKNCEFYSAAGGVFIKGSVGGQFQHTIRIHHNHIHDVDMGMRLANTSPHSGAVQGTYGCRVYQNIIESTDDAFMMNGYNSPAPEDCVIANNLLINNASVSQAAIYMKDGWYDTADPIIFRNNIVANFNKMYSFDAWTVGDLAALDIDDCTYHNFTSAFGTDEGGADRATLDLWVANTAWDDNSQDADPTFVNEVGGDYRLDTGSPCLDAGTDYLDLLGGGTAAAINHGPYISAGQTEEIGLRASPTY